MTAQVEKIKNDVSAQQKAFTIVISLLEKIHDAMNAGFEEVNGRLAVLEGKQGMQGVNEQLTEIKNELNRIHTIYPYKELFENTKIISGQA